MGKKEVALGAASGLMDFIEAKRKAGQMTDDEWLEACINYAIVEVRIREDQC